MFNPNRKRHSKVKESKVKESKVKESKVNTPLNSPEGISVCDESKKLISEISEKWNVVELSEQHRQIKKFVEVVRYRGEFKFLKNQFIFYHRYKDKADEKKHNIKNFMGEYPFKTGAWTECNWEKKFKSLKNDGTNERNITAVKSYGKF